MIFFITTESSYEIPTPNILELEENLNLFFDKRNYGDAIAHISTIVICVSKEFDFLHPVRPNKISKKKSKLGFEFKLDFQTYKAMNDEERLKYIASEYFKNLKNIFTSKPIKGFDSELFIQDLEAFLTAEKLLI
ncbi:MAG: hypothetical protein EAZ46_09100 [Runella sp.]|nr:MAG: hypothetical protein EAZ46_09100 [Runella sp.]